MDSTHGIRNGCILILRGRALGAPQVCGQRRLQTSAPSARWAEHQQHDWYECGGGEGAATLQVDWRQCARGNQAPTDRPQPLAPRLPSADVVIVLAKARERGRCIVAVSRPFDFGRREWKLHSWPLSAVQQRLRDELERHNDQWARLGSKGGLSYFGFPHTCKPADRAPTAAADAAEPPADADADADDTAVPQISHDRFGLFSRLLISAFLGAGAHLG